MAAAILHDIGKLRELDYHPVEAKYTKEGQLIGHVMIGRDLVRDAARKIEGFPLETLLLLEHAILAHHGKREFGAPIVPLTLEALLVSYVDDLDAKMNIAARHRLLSSTDGEFTDKVYALDNRRFYKGIPSGTSGRRRPARARLTRRHQPARPCAICAARLQCPESSADRFSVVGATRNQTASQARETTLMSAIRKFGWSALVLAAFAGCAKEEPAPATPPPAETKPAATDAKPAPGRSRPRPAR